MNNLATRGSVSAVILLTSTLAAQTPSLDLARGEYTAAKEAQQRKDTEACALHIRRARVALSNTGSEHHKAADQILRSINKYAKRHDPRDAARSKALRKAAKQLVRAAENYIAADWFTFAEPLLRDARGLDPATAAPSIEAMGKAREASIGAGGDGALTEMFFDGEIVWGDDTWRFVGDELHSPDYDKSKYLRIGSRRMEFGENGRSVEIEFGTNNLHEVALVFAYRHTEEFLSFRYIATKGDHGAIQLLQSKDREFTVLAEQNVTLSETESASFTRLRIAVEEGALHVALGSREPLVVPMPAGRTSGFLGLMVRGGQSEHPPVVFRNLVLRGFE